MTNTKEFIDPNWVFDNHNEAAKLIDQLQARCAELEQENNHLNHVMKSHDQVCDHLGAMIAERDALAAHVERLRVFGEAIIERGEAGGSEEHWIYPSIQVFKRGLSKIPQQSLAEHDAELARKAITKAKETFVLGSNGNEDFQAGVDYCLDAYDKHLDRYAQRIMEQKNADSSM